MRYTAATIAPVMMTAAQIIKLRPLDLAMSIPQVWARSPERIFAKKESFPSPVLPIPDSRKLDNRNGSPESSHQQPCLNKAK
jgi:hypothetical protein